MAGALGMISTPAFLFQAGCVGVYLVNNSIEVIIPNDYTQPWNVEVHDIFYLSSGLGCVHVLCISVCSPGKLGPGVDIH